MTGLSMHTIFDLTTGRLRDESAASLEERVTNEGLRGRWYAVTASHEVNDLPVRVERLGESLVLWRDSKGAVQMQEDRCPHRGARLSQGRVIDDTIACSYHGIAIDIKGCIAKVPALPGSPIEGRCVVNTYVVREYGQLIFAYFPTPQNECAPAFEGPPELIDPQWSVFPIEMTWKTNWRYALENVMDPMHGPYLHGDSHSMSVGSKDDFMEIVDTERGFRIQRKLQTATAFDYCEMVDTGLLWLFLDIPYPRKVGPGGPFRIIGFATPIDESTSQIFFYRLRKVTGWQRDLWRFLHRNRLAVRHWDVLEQDRSVLESLPSDAREHEVLYQHDIGVTRLRRYFKAQARAHIDAARNAPTQQGSSNHLQTADGGTR